MGDRVYNAAFAPHEAPSSLKSRGGVPTRVTPKVLVIDDDPGIRATFEEMLRSFGCEVDSASDGESALHTIKQEAYEVVFVDYRLPNADGIEILSEVKAFHPETEVVVITGEGNEQLVRTAFKNGALDYITKPVRMSDLEIIVHQALERQRLRRENQELRRQNRDLKNLIDSKDSFKSIIGSTVEM